MNYRTKSAPPQTGSNRHRQQGQSLVEMAIALTVLIPLAVGVMLLGQFIHIKLQTQNAAREVAWAATVDPALATAVIPSKTTEEIQLRQHHFADADTAVRSGGSAPTGFPDPMLTTFAGRPLLNPADLTLKVYQQQASPSYLDQVISMLGNALSDTLPPNRQGLVTAEVHANTTKILSAGGAPLQFLGSLADKQLDFSAKTVLLADTWDAAGGGETLNGESAGGAYANRTVRAVIQPMVPSTWLGSLSSVINGAAKLLGSIPLINDLLTPNMDHFEMGRTAPDVVPVDKLVK